jgi:signal transduction histidine kinase
MRPVWLLSLAVLVPTACLLWFMNVAMQNESLALRQRLAEAYLAQLGALQTRLEVFWQRTAEDLEDLDRGGWAAAWFARVVQSGKADALVVLDSQGRPAYPDFPSVSAADHPEPDAEWVEANCLEWFARDWVAAAGRYEKIAAQTDDANLAARALQGQARCLMQAGKKADAIRLVTESLEQDRFRNATDAQGRLIVANDELMVLELLNDQTSVLFQETAAKLRRRLQDYRHSPIASPQRRFLMHSLQTLSPTNSNFPTLAAEELAARFLDTRPGLPEKAKLSATSLADVWQLRTPDGRGLALFRTATLAQRLQQVTQNHDDYNTDVTLSILPPGSDAEPPFVSMAAGRSMPGWLLAVSLKGPSPFEAATRHRLAAYLWTGVLTVLAVYILALIAARSLQREVALSRLKNDLVATVSHELKTPLASIRVLVDTLLGPNAVEAGTSREYLELIARENDRLTRVIENFLTFSRMERNKYAFHFTSVPPNQIIESVARTVQPRFEAPGCQFQVQSAQNLPPIQADADTLVTALLNLLDNAFKYSEASKRISLRASAHNGSIVFAVEDNGVGIPHREIRRIFLDFYQVDQQLSRKGSGCGLGLSIVRHIVKAHGGTVEVSSEVGRGSTFKLVIPAIPRTYEPRMAAG